MRLNFEKIVSDSVTVLVATVVVGAAVQLWRGVQTIDNRIDENLVEIRATQKVLAPRVDEIAAALEELLEHLDHGDTFKKPAVGSLDLIERTHNNQMQQQHIQQAMPVDNGND